MIIEFIFALAFLGQEEAAPVPERITCHVRYLMRRHGAIRARSECPDVPGHDWLRWTTSDQVNMAQIRVPHTDFASEMSGRSENRRDSGQVTYTSYEVDGVVYWAIQPGAITLREPDYPLGASPSDWMASCIARFDIIDGQAENICTACNADAEPGLFRNAMREAIHGSVLVNTEQPGEIIYRYAFTLDERPALSFPETPSCGGGGQ
ncbi:hypothetical protein [Hyphobacterium sp.]|uniref:hypothetical protein n=1 Tax=Hyphobacterium sp. TaxID=2004662 RepID=UPI003BA8520C